MLRHDSDVTNQATYPHLGLFSSLVSPFQAGVPTLKQKISLRAYRHVVTLLSEHTSHMNVFSSLLQSILILHTVHCEKTLPNKNVTYLLM